MNTEEKNKLAEENLGLVYLVVNKEFTYEKTTESDRENYIEEGMIGLAKAINTFNPSKGAKFSTYAYTCIKFEINSYVRKKNNHKRKINYVCKNSIDEYIKTHKDILMDTKDAYSSLVNRDEILNILGKMKIKNIKYTYREEAIKTMYKERVVNPIINAMKNHNYRKIILPIYVPGVKIKDIDIEFMKRQIEAKKLEIIKFELSSIQYRYTYNMVIEIKRKDVTIYDHHKQNNTIHLIGGK